MSNIKEYQSAVDVIKTAILQSQARAAKAICAFANDLPNSRKNGYLILGAYDNGELSGLKVTDDLLKKIAAIRSNGNILPIPVMSVDRFQFPEGDLLVAAKDATSSSKVATSDEKVASSGLKDATLKKKISSEEMAIYILEYCSTWRTMDEIAQFANRDKNYIRNKVLPRLAEKLEKEHPDVPNHPRQRYRTIAKE